MWLIAGTVPELNFPLHIEGVYKESRVEGDTLVLSSGRKIPIARGTSALAATAILTCQALGVETPRLLLVGDCGTGLGSKTAYDWLYDNMGDLINKERLLGITFHYFYPDLDAHNRLYSAIENLRRQPLLVADAGFMYVAKMSGYATNYDLFTPDIGELAFLADEKAPHPFYTRGFLLESEENAPAMIESAISCGNCPANMIVKGKTDYIVCEGLIKAEVSEPSVPAMECIGGTGDLVTGFVTAYLIAGNSICDSALRAARSARYLAAFCQPDPATQIASLIEKIVPMLNEKKKCFEKM